MKFESGSLGTAVFSDCELYRYRLDRFPLYLDDSLFQESDVKPSGMVNFCMLNPSKATHLVNDPTITRCIGYAIAWGYARLVITNIFAFRSTDPEALFTVDDPIGPDNDSYIESVARDASLIVCAWGAHGNNSNLGFRKDKVIRKLSTINRLHALKVNADGSPCHPLYLPKNLKPIPFGVSA